MSRRERDEVRTIRGLCVSCPRPRKRGHTRCQDSASTGTPCYTGNPELHGRRKPRPVSQITGGCDRKPLEYRYTRVQAEAGSLCIARVAIAKYAERIR